MSWVNKDTEIYCSFAKNAGNTGCQMMNSAFYYHGLNKIYKSFSVNDIGNAVKSVKILNIKGFAITMPYKVEVLDYVDEMSDEVKDIGAANTVLNKDGILKAYNTDYLAARHMFITNEIESDLYILGNGGYSRAVQSAAKSLDIDYQLITRNNWNLDMKDSVIYNCTPIENIRGQLDESNKLIDCIVSTGTGHRLATIQAAHQYELYTGLTFPYV